MVGYGLRCGTPEYSGRGRRPGYSAKRGSAVYKANRSRCHPPQTVHRDMAFILWMAAQVSTNRSGSFDTCVGRARRTQLFPAHEIPCTKPCTTCCGRVNCLSRCLNFQRCYVNVLVESLGFLLVFWKKHRWTSTRSGRQKHPWTLGSGYRAGPEKKRWACGARYCGANDRMLSFHSDWLQNNHWCCRRHGWAQRTIWGEIFSDFPYHWMSLPPSPPLKPLVRRSILHIPTPPGSNLSAREPTVSCADSSTKVIPFTSTPMIRFSSLLTKSMPLPESVLATILPRNCLSSNWIESTLPTDSVLYSNQVFNLLLQFSTKKYSYYEYK